MLTSIASYRQAALDKYLHLCPGELAQRLPTLPPVHNRPRLCQGRWHSAYHHWLLLTTALTVYLHACMLRRAGTAPTGIASYQQPAPDILRQDPPLDLSFWSFLTFLHHGIEEVEKHLLRKFYKKIRRKSLSNVPPKLVACIGFLYKVVHKIGRLRKFNRSRGI